MLDKEIRKSLKQYLSEKNKNIKFFEEVVIGSSVCDLMSVGDGLVGYEIKSDGDSYSRLKTQTKDYSDYFENNYIVVGESHLNVEDKVPPNWGIIVVGYNGIRIERRSNKNYKVEVGFQLKLLWKIELNNLLYKNNLPSKPLADKNEIIAYLLSRVQPYALKSQVAEELKGREEGGFEDFYVDPQFDAESSIVDMLSEQNFNNITMDYWISLFARAKKVHELKNAVISEKFDCKVDADFDINQINISLGSVLVKPFMIDEFIYHLAEVSIQNMWAHYSTQFYESSGYWKVPYKDRFSQNNYRIYNEFGEPEYNALRLIEAVLNGYEIKVTKSYKNKRIVDEEKTVSILEKKKRLEIEFVEFIKSREDLVYEIFASYRQLFCREEVLASSRKELNLEGISQTFHLYDYQKDAIQKIIEGNNTLLAYDVGAGKTAVMIVAAMEMKKSGLSPKNMFVVPNSIVGQWGKMFLEIYPNAKILLIGSKDFKPSLRSKIIKQIRENDYDGIIVAYSCFEMLKISAKGKIALLNKDIADLSNKIDKYRYQNISTRTTNAIYKIKDLIKCVEQESEQESDEYSFDNFGITSLFVDEAHNYKNLPIDTNLKNIRGINTVGSKKCQEMLEKVRCVNQQNQGRGVIFATATPICNSIADTYVMQMYLQHDMLKEKNLHIFNNWIKTFSRQESQLEITPTATKYRYVTRFSKFYCMEELSKIFSNIAIYYAKEEVDLPVFAGYTNVEIPKSDSLQQYMMKLAERSEKIYKKEVPMNADNMLKVSSDARKCALDMRLVDEDISEAPQKLIELQTNVLRIYNENDCNVQLIFCDLSTPKNQFNVYEEIKRMLVDKGVNPQKIAFVHYCKNDIERLKLFEKVNDGEIRILIGSTFKLGIGVNVQKKLKAVHHLDVPWRPSDMVQRDGRIMRKGNSQEKIDIYRYITKGTFDAYNWQLLENKQKFISQFLAGSAYQKTIEDLSEDVLSYSKVKSIALEEPLMKQLTEVEIELEKNRILYNKQLADKINADKEINELLLSKEILEKDKFYLEMYHIDRYLIEDKCAERIDYNELASYVENKDDRNKKTIYEFKITYERSGFYLHITFETRKDENNSYIDVVSNNRDNTIKKIGEIKVGSSIAGNKTRVNNFIKNMPKLIDKLTDEIQTVSDKIELLRKQKNEKYETQEKIEELTYERNMLLDQIEKSKHYRK